MIHYPAPVELADSTSSSSLRPESARRINSTPALQSDGGAARNSSRRGIRIVGRIGDRGSKVRRCPPSDRPADSPHPIIDISSLDYKAYRHRLIGATLRKQYDDFQPPADVVLNSLHLNSADSVIGIRLNDRYDHSIFDFVEEYYDVAGTTSRENVERHHPLDHFLLGRGAGRPRTSEKETETISDNDGVDRENGRNHLPESVDSNPAKLPGMDDNGNPCVRASPDDVFAIATGDRDPRSEVPIFRRSIPTRSRADKTTLGHEVEDASRRSAERSDRKESSRTGRRPASAGNASKVLSLPGAAILPENREATGSPRPETSAGESRKKLEDYPPAVLSLSGKRRAEREAGGRSNFISVSSSEIASDSSKRRDDEVSCRSRESSISPRSRVSSRPPWLSGYRGTSFNRKYGRNITEISAPRVAMARGGGPPRQRLASSRGCSEESSTSRSPLPGRRATSFVAPRGRELDGVTTERQQRGENLATRPREQRNKSRDVGSTAAEDNERGRTLKTADSPPGEKTSGSGMTTSPDNAALSFLSSPARTLVRSRKRSPRAAFSADASKTSATKKPELISRRGLARGRPASGNNASRAVRDLAKLNRDGRRQLKSAENPSKGASLSPRIELSAEVLNPVDDTDKSAILPDGEKLAGLTFRIDSRERAGAAVSDRIRAEGAKAATGNDVKSNSANDVARSGPPRITRSLRARPASANDLAEGRDGSAAASQPALRDANSETRGGLSGAKLNARSNGAVDEMRYDESPSAKASSRAPREGGNAAAARGADEELRLPRHDSKVGLAMNFALRRYIKMLRQGLLNHGDKSGVALASLSLSDAVSILSERRTPLSPEEIRELQTVLDRIERNPELLSCKLSRTSMESLA